MVHPPALRVTQRAERDKQELVIGGRETIVMGGPPFRARSKRDPISTGRIDLKERKPGPAVFEEDVNPRAICVQVTPRDLLPLHFTGQTMASTDLLETTE